MRLCQHPEGCLHYCESGTEMCATHNHLERKKSRDEEKEKHKRSRQQELSKQRDERYRANERKRQTEARDRNRTTGSIEELQRCNGPKDSSRPKGKIRVRSPRRAAEERRYNKRVKEWLQEPENEVCRVCQGEQEEMPNRATECHHMKSRIGALLMDERYWLPICRMHHIFITEHSLWAIQNRYSLPRNH